MRNIIVSLFFIALSLPAYSNFDFNQNCRNAYEKMMIFDFTSVQRILEIEKKQNPNNRVADYIENYTYFWKAALNEDEEKMDLYADKADDLIDAIEDDNQVSPYKNYFLSDIYLRGAYLKAMQTSYMSAAYKFNKAYNLVQKNRKEYPDFIPNKKLIGLMNVGIGTVPSKYTWVLNIFNFEGNIQEGLNELESLLRFTAENGKYHYLMSESLLLYSFTMENFEVSKASENKLLAIYKWDVIKKELPKNQFMIFSKASFLKHIKKTDGAITCIKAKQTVSGAMHFYYLDYLMGECLLNKLDYSAASYFNNYATNYHGNSYRRGAYRKWAWTYLLQGKKDLYKSKMKACLNNGNDNRDADRQATKEAESGIVPNISLLKARLLFDGGYYDKASKMLSLCNKNGFSEKENLEYIYRMGRIYDEWGKQNLAISNYQKCINEGREQNYYFAANSALHLGYIYEENGDKVKAKQMYEDCLDMDFDEYRDGIEQKAKAALERVE